MPEIWLPRSFTGTKPKFRCRLCGQAEYTPESQARHVARCYDRNESEVRMASPRLKAPGLCGDSNVDVEFEQWHRRRGIEEI